VLIDGGIPQMKAIQDAELLKDKQRKNIDLLQFAKKASRAQQPCDMGLLYVRQDHHSKDIAINNIRITLRISRPIETQHCCGHNRCYAVFSPFLSIDV
jgi:hypothetical protein